MATIINVIDSAVKIGLGAAIAGITSYLITARNHNHESRKRVEENNRTIAMDLSMKIEKVQSLTGESAFSYHSGDIVSAKKAIVSAGEELCAASALANILGNDDLVKLVEQMVEVDIKFYAELNREEPNEETLAGIQLNFYELKMAAYPLIRTAYNCNQA